MSRRSYNINKPVICGIYKITSPSGRVYVGHSIDIYWRWVSYINEVCKTQPKLYRSLQKYGSENHTFDILEECDFNSLLIKERYWQEFYDVIGPKGLNCLLVGTSEKKAVFSEEYKRKIGEKSLGRVAWNKGLPCTEENKINLRIKALERNSKKTDQEKVIQRNKILKSCGKKISQYSLEGDFIASYESINEAFKITGITRQTIRNSLNKERKPKYFKWEYSQE